MESQPPKNLSHHLSRVTRNIQPSSVKGFYKYFRLPGISNLAAGFPNPGYFPFDTLEARSALVDRFEPTPTKPLDPPPTSIAASSSSSPTVARVVVPHDDSETNLFRKIDLTSALQYGTAQGYPPLHTFVEEFTKKLHPNIPYAGGAEVILTCGNTDGFSKAMRAFNNAWDPERDWIRDREGMLVEEFAYMSPIQVAKPRGMNVVTVKMDGQGMMADGAGGLKDVLSNWDKSKGRIPHLMYTVTMGQNPTSGLMSLSRKKKIYALCQQYDILIIEDEPYWYLQYPSALELSARYKRENLREHSVDDLDGWKSSGSDFLDSLVPSYLSIDVDGRVIRLDTFSKTVAPGCRLGWITAQPAFIERLERMTETSTQQPSGFVQSLMAELLLGPSHASKTSKKNAEKEPVGWQVDGFVRWLEGLRGNYERRMQAMSQILEDGKYTTHQDKRRISTSSDDFEIVEAVKMFDFEFPMAGMFLWLRCQYETHPLYDQIEHQRLARALWVHLTTEPSRILVVPGTIFAGSGQVLEEKAWQYFRLCFAAIEEKELENISKRFLLGMSTFWDIDDPKAIDDLLEDDEVADVEGRMSKLASL